MRRDAPGRLGRAGVSRARATWSGASLPFAILTVVNTPYRHGFYCSDDSIRYPYHPDTITHGIMASFTITATVILVLVGEAYLVYIDRLYSRSDFNNYVAAVYKVLGTFLFGVVVNLFLTDLAKYMIDCVPTSCPSVTSTGAGSTTCSWTCAGAALPVSQRPGGSELWAGTLAPDYRESQWAEEGGRATSLLCQHFLGRCHIVTYPTQVTI